MSEGRSRKSTVFLVAVLLLLLLLLCGLLWVYRSLSTSPDRAVVEAEIPGVQFEFGAYQYTDAEGAQVSLEKPVGVAYDGDDRIYVTEPTKDTIVVFDADGKNGRIFVKDDRTVAKPALADYLVIRPLGIDVDANGDVYVASMEKAAVVVFDSAGNKLREIPVMAPRYLHVEDGVLYVLSKGTLYVYDTNGTEIGRWGTYGRGPDQMSYPCGVTVTKDGTILVADTNNYRIVALSPDLEPVWIFGKAAVTPEEQNARLLASPTGLALNDEGTIFMVDMLNSFIRLFNPSGGMVGDPLGEAGDLDNQFYYPTAIDFMGDDLFVIADQGNDRVLGVHLNAVGEQVISPEGSAESTGSAQ